VVAGGRGGRRHTEQAAGRLRHSDGALQVPDVLPTEHEHRARAGDGPLQQAAADHKVQSSERPKGHQRLRRHVRRTRRSRQQRAEGYWRLNLAGELCTDLP